MKKLFSNVWLVVFGLILLILISSGIVALATDSYSSGKLAVQPELNDTTSEFKERVQQLQIDLIEKREENTQLQAQVSSLQLEKQQLIESGLASEEQIAELDAQIVFKNQLIEQNEITISALSNRVAKFISIIDKTVTEVTAEDLEGLTKIGDYAFYRCLDLVSVELPDSITTIGSYAFYQSGLDNIKFSIGLKYIRSYAFSQTGLTNVDLPSSVTQIDSHAFDSCLYLTEIKLNEGLDIIGEYAFSGCKITTLSLPDTLTTLRKYAFSNCKELTGTISKCTITNRC